MTVLAKVVAPERDAIGVVPILPLTSSVASIVLPFVVKLDPIPTLPLLSRANDSTIAPFCLV